MSLRMRSESEYLIPRRVFAARVREARRRRGWKQKDLSNRLDEIGYQLGRATIAKIEDPTRTRADASLEDVLAIAAALDVAPVHLLAPLEDEAVVRITDGLPPASAEIVRDWIRGMAPLRVLVGLPQSVDDVAAFLSQVPEPEFRHVAEVMGLSDNQTDDLLSAVRTREDPDPWPAVPRRDRARLLRTRADLVRQLASIDAQLDGEPSNPAAPPLAEVRERLQGSGSPPAHAGSGEPERGDHDGSM